ncbi:MAG: (Fe-S)-binding protein, partial [Candidatus Hodarchaeota archaeon]
MNKKRILSTLLGIGILLAIVPTVLGNYGLFPNFSGDSHGGCHVGTNPESSNGWIYVTSNASTVDPSEEFMLSVQVVTFTEAANANISIGFPDNRGNNNYFTFSIKYFNNITLDGSGNSTVLYFTVIAPSEDGDYTLVVDALKGHINGTAKNFNWTAGSVGVTVSSIIGGGPTTLLGQFIEFITNPYVFYSLITILLGILMGLGIKLKRRLDRSRILKADTLKDREKLGIKLKEYAENDIIKECANCTMCRDECPTFYSREAESYYAGGRLRVLRAYVEQGYPIDDDFVEAMYYCTTCKQCEDRCPVPVKYVDIIEELRANLVKHKVGPYGKQLGMAKAVHANKNPYNEPADCRGNWCTEDEDIAKDIKTLERGPVGYFVGCTASFRTKNAAQNTAKILSKITDGIVILGSGEYCCGSPLIRTGQEDFDLPLNDKET